MTRLIFIPLLLTFLSLSTILNGQIVKNEDNRNQQVLLTGSVIEKWPDAGTAVVQQKIMLDSVVVSGPVYLSGSEFLDELTIANSRFHSRAIFYNDKTKNGSVLFHKNTCFLNDEFFGRVDFRNATAFSNAYFEGNRFYKPVDFTKTKFSDSVSFSKSRFYDDAHFVCDKFGAVADFSYCHFAHKAFFSSLVLGLKSFVSFNEAVLPDTLDFSQNGFIPNRIDLTAANFDDTGKHYIFLDETDISQLDIDYEHFRLIFIDPKTPTLGLIKKENIVGIYTALLANFKNANRWSSYNTLMKEFTNYNNGEMNFADRFWYLYASRPENIVMITLLVFFLLSLINVAFYHSMDCKVYTLKNFSGAPLIDNSNTKNNFLKKLSNSFIYTGIIFFTFGLKVDELHYDHRRLFAWFFVNYLLGLVALFFLTHLLFNTHVPTPG